MQQGTQGGLCPPNLTVGGTAPCVERQSKIISVKVAQHGVGKLAFSLFRENDRDDSISYRDLHTEIAAAVAMGYKPECIKTAMFKSMEGMAKDHAANIDQYGVLTTLEIFEGLDQLYEVSMPFQSFVRPFR